jgi:hypothetical protein
MKKVATSKKEKGLETVTSPCLRRRVFVFLVTGRNFDRENRYSL